jgi:hypothetical protein
MDCRSRPFPDPGGRLELTALPVRVVNGELPIGWTQSLWSWFSGPQQDEIKLTQLEWD